MDIANPTGNPRSALAQIEHDLRNAATIMVGVAEEVHAIAADLPEVGPLAGLLAQALQKVLDSANGIQSLRRAAAGAAPPP